MSTNPFMGGNVIPYILVGVQPTQQREQVHFSNIVKTFANQNVCYSCGFDFEDWHTSALRNGATRTDSIAQITWSTNAQTTPPVAKQCTRLYT
jgi:hypothetical protein